MLNVELTAAFLNAHQKTFLPNTQLAYGYDLRLFQRAFPDLDIRDITIQHLRAFLQDTADLAPSTVARRQATLRSCFRARALRWDDPMDPALVQLYRESAAMYYPVQ
ncbi:MAG TPA: site-specific integrase [Roseiflexaceae bacterium]|nr:site-specific integrase [Roseiflexaceae bacterium]